MTAFWHPLSAVYLDEPRVRATPTVLRMLLAGEGRASIVYAGDRMWPAIRHGSALVVGALGGGGARPGEVVLALAGGVPDVLRVFGRDPDVAVGGDAEAEAPREIGAAEILGRVEGAAASAAAWRGIRRTWLDLREAWTAGPDPAPDAAATVREKYDRQAAHYARLEGDALDSDLRERVEASVDRGGRILVAGSGSGREAFALESLGYDVVGIDFAPVMVEAARAEARRRGARSTFVAADLRAHDEPAGSLAAVVFTYDVYSFLPSSGDRIALLRRIRRWLGPTGTLFLSARRLRGSRAAATLAVQHVARRLKGRPGRFGDTHTRWLDASGSLHRAYVHVFSEGALARETSAAGFRSEGWRGGHGLYRAAEEPAG